jgi:hypothetical protein
MAYTTGKNIQRYQRLRPDIQTEWGVYTNPHMMFHPSEYKFRQPGVPMIARGRTDVIHPQPMGPQHLGYVGDYVPGPMGESAPGSLLSGDTLKTVLIIAGVLAVLYLLFRDKGTQKNPTVADLNAMLDTGWTPPAGLLEGSKSKRRTQTRAGKKSLRRHALRRPRDSKGRFI